MAPKGMSIRLSDDMAADLVAVAEVDGMPISEAIREAISKHIAERQLDKAFQARLKEHLERKQKIVERLSE